MMELWGVGRALTARGKRVLLALGCLMVALMALSWASSASAATPYGNYPYEGTTGSCGATAYASCADYLASANINGGGANNYRSALIQDGQGNVIRVQNQMWSCDLPGGAGMPFDCHWFDLADPAASASNYTGSTPYNTPLTFTPPTSYAGGVAVVSQPAQGTASASGTSLTYTPPNGFIGTTSFTWYASGSGGNSATVTATITVQAPPIPTVSGSGGGGASIATNFNSPGSTTLTATSATTMAVASGPAHGSVSVSGFTVTYTPNTNYIGSDSFTVTATGPGGTSAPATVSVTVAPPPPPTISGSGSGGAGSISTTFNEPGSTTLSATDAQSLAVATPATHGSVSVSGFELIYTPQANYIGSDSFTVTATGLGGTSPPLAIAVTVAPPPPPVTAAASAATAFETPVTFALPVTGIFDSIAMVDPPAHGTISLSGTSATYSPAADYVGLDSFTFKATGPGGVSNTESAAITVASPGLPAVSDANVSTPQDTAVDISLAVSGVFWDVVVDAAPGHGATAISGTSIRYTPQGGFSGADTFAVLARGPGGDSFPATINVSVVAAPPPPEPEPEPEPPTPTPEPVATPLVQEGRKGQPIVFHISRTGVVSRSAPSLMAKSSARAAAAPDVGEAVGVELVTPPATGAARVQGMDVIYQPPEDFTGTAEFEYRLAMASGIYSRPATLTAIVHPDPTPILPALLEGQGVAGKPITVDLTQGATGGPFTGAAIVSIAPEDAGEGVVTATEDGRYLMTWRPNGQFTGEATVRYTLSNSSGTSQPGIVRLTVAVRPDPGRDADVIGLVNAQAGAMRRFGSAQISNVSRRMEAVRRGAESDFGVSLSPMRHDRDPFSSDSYRRASRDGLKPANMASVRAALRANDTNGGPKEPQAVNVWASGVVEVGSRDGASGRSGIDFQTDGISAGLDVRVSDRLLLGAGAGYGRDESEIGERGTKSDATALSGFVYGSFQPTKRGYLEALVGVSDIDFSSRRYVGETGNIVTGDRSGTSVFASLAGGYDFEAGGWRLTPYGRLEYTIGRLNAFTEQGDDTYALRYYGHNVENLTGALGLQADYPMEAPGGVFVPTFRAEYREALADSGKATASYADWQDSPLYRLNLTPYEARSLVLGTGLSWRSTAGVQLSIDAETTALQEDGRSVRLRAAASGSF